MRNMIRPSLLGLLVPIAWTMAHGQCNIQVNTDPSQSFIFAYCGQFGDPGISGAVRWTGGTAPFHIYVSYGNGSAESAGVMSSPYYFEQQAYGYSNVDGATVQITDVNGCSAYTAIPYLNGITGVAEPYGQMRSSLTASNCGTGVFTATITDNPAQEPSLFYEPLTGYTFYLIKNGLTISSGSLAPYYQSNPPRFVFPGLTAGEHHLYIVTGTGTGHSTIYCPSDIQMIFYVPGPNDCQTNVSLKLGLEGARQTDALMSDALRTSGVLPTSEPYSGLGYTYTGIAPGATAGSALFAVTGNNAVVDWVIVELRNSVAPYAVVSSRPALLQRDGDVMDLDGDPYVAFPVAPGTYRVSVRHRNHLAAMTHVAYALGMDHAQQPIDFRSMGNATYGTQAMKNINGVSYLWEGDATGNGVLNYTGANNDRDPILQAVGGSTPNAVLSNVYSQRDVNMDGVVKYTGANNDRDPILVNIGGAIPTNTRLQQLP